jgi:small subunit ribosomal protein S14
MAKVSSVNKNNHRRKLVQQHASKRKKLKDMANDMATTSEARFAARLKLAEMPRNGAKVRIRNRCELTGRSRAYYRKLKLCRNQLRELASQGMIPGMVKSSW